MIDDESLDLNKTEEEEFKPSINKGVELLLRNKKRGGESPKTFQVKFGKLISFLNREVDIFFNFYLDFKKSKS